MAAASATRRGRARCRSRRAATGLQAGQPLLGRGCRSRCTFSGKASGGSFGRSQPASTIVQGRQDLLLLVEERLQSFVGLGDVGGSSDSLVGPLFGAQAFRHGRNGPLIAKSRLLFIAEFAERFGEKVIAELRGRVDAQGRSPFWEGLGRHFFAMEYSTADYLTGIGQKSFIAELMPKHPVYVNLLPADARDAIGAVHADTEPAQRMLEQEGFRYDGSVDIFDAGPTVEAFRDNIDAVRRSRLLPVTLDEVDPVPDNPAGGVPWLVGNRSFGGFRASLATAPPRVDRLPLEPHQAAALGVGEGDLVRAVPLAPIDR